MAPFLTTLLYPLPPSGSPAFDIDYYLKTHMPLVESRWGKTGLVKYTVVSLAPESGYSTQCILEWESKEKYETNFFGEHNAEIMGDIEKFSVVKPVAFGGKAVGGN